MPCFPSSTLLLTGEAEFTHLCRRLFFKPFPHQVRQYICQPTAVNSIENSTHTISNKSIQYQISVCCHPLITVVYTETEFYVMQEAKWASRVRQLLECSSLRDPFPTAYIRASLSDFLALLQLAPGGKAMWSFRIYTDVIFLSQRALCTAGPFGAPVCEQRTLQ